MNSLKKLLGIIWILLGPAAIFFLAQQAYTKVGEAYAKADALTDAAAKAAANDIALNSLLQWGIIILIFVPIAFGLVIFGKYAMQGDYNKLPHSSAEITDY